MNIYLEKFDVTTKFEDNVTLLVVATLTFFQTGITVDMSNNADLWIFSPDCYNC